MSVDEVVGIWRGMLNFLLLDTRQQLHDYFGIGLSGV